MELLGRQGRLEIMVENKHTAAAMGSGLAPVFATPCLVALMEGAACKALNGALNEGYSSVGSRIDVRHTAATPVGMRVWAEAKLVAEEGRMLTFEIEAFDEAGRIGQSFHERVIVDEARFMAKVNAKRL